MGFFPLILSWLLYNTLGYTFFSSCTQIINRISLILIIGNFLYQRDVEKGASLFRMLVSLILYTLPFFYQVYAGNIDKTTQLFGTPAVVAALINSILWLMYSTLINKSEMNQSLLLLHAFCCMSTFCYLMFVYANRRATRKISSTMGFTLNMFEILIIIVTLVLSSTGNRNADVEAAIQNSDTSNVPGGVAITDIASVVLIQAIPREMLPVERDMYVPMLVQALGMADLRPHLLVIRNLELHYRLLLIRRLEEQRLIADSNGQKMKRKQLTEESSANKRMKIRRSPWRMQLPRPYGLRRFRCHRRLTADA
ncbi:hypothetical protein C2845_PM04G00590 [Panicum miliaceum]|uniref:Bidirectional sugar transporter SWEET n=1 Tax=Panicum miliaceum TaxID=4540 RepID=A0A3L6QMJ3_PANMI|nr:hypothetical protein C2845_PM04G00590 [Panicum miliaceum]